MSAAADRIAVVGMAGHFPGADSVDALWTLLVRGGVGVRRFEREELIDAGVPVELVDDPCYVPVRGCLDRPYHFDAAAFDILPAEARLLDPQQRLFLECACSALEHAGYGARAGRGTVGVFAGAASPQYLRHLIDALGASARAPFALDGVFTDFLALRAAYKLDLRGPAVTVGTACSSSLVAVHLACQSLLLGETELALAGGVSVAVPDRAGRLWQEDSIVARDGCCRPFDRGASGTVGGDAVACVVLKRLDRALADRDTVHAVIRGSAVDNDGAGKAGFTAPSIEAQVRVLRDALAVAGLDAGGVDYVEAHGSGTALGDGMEWAALGEVFRERQRRLAVGAIKANVGHTDAAAGLCGLIKTVLCLRERTLVPTPGFEALHPRLDGAAPLAVQTETTPWSPPAGRARVAGVTSLGMGGTNVHVVLEEAPERSAATPTHPWYLLPLSARTQPALERMTTALAEHLAVHPELPLGDVACTLQVGREAFVHRRCVVARTTVDAANALATRDDDAAVTDLATTGRRVGFLFPGLGETGLYGARSLHRHAPAFRAAFDTCGAAFARTLGVDVAALLDRAIEDPFRGWSRRGSNRERTPTALAQAAVFSANWALYSLWRSIGVEPDVLAGVSLGEYVAATAADVFSLDDALAIVAERARLVAALPEGAMTAVALPAAELQARAPAGVEIAVADDELCVAAGTEDDIDRLESALATDDVLSMRLDARHPFHTGLLGPATAPLAAAIARRAPGRPRRPLLSNLTGDLHGTDRPIEAGYWAEHLVRPVQLGRMLRKLAEEPERLLIQVGPGAQLARLAIRAGCRPPIVSLPTEVGGDGNDGDDQGLRHWLIQVGRAWSAGVAVDWQKLDPSARGRVPLPTYAFERRRYLVEATSSVAAEPCVSTATLPSPTMPPAAPSSAHERIVLDVWRATFGLPDLGVDDDFFALGGHSLLALQLLHRLRREHGIDLSVRVLIEERTVARLARRLAGASASPPPAPRLAPGDGSPRARRRAIEDYLAERLASALGTSADGVRTAADLGALGFEAQLAEVIGALRHDLALVVYPHELLRCRTLGALADLVLVAMGELAPPPRTRTEARASIGAPQASIAPPDRNPPIVFLLSSARSGSTLLRVMLAGHPRLFCPPELHLLMFNTLRERATGLGSVHFGRGLPRALMELLHVTASEAEHVVAEWVARDFTTARAFAELQRLARPRMLVDKSPSYAEEPATLARADAWFASSYPIVLARHPYAVMASYVRNRIGALARDAAPDPWAQAEHHFRTCYRNIFAFVDHAPRPLHLLRYEDLVREPATAMRGLCESLGIGFHPDTLTPYHGRRMIDGIGDPGFHEHRTIDATLGEAWRKVRPPRALHDETRRLAERLGYDLGRETP